MSRREVTESSLGTRFREERERLRLEPNEAQRWCGVSREMISRYENDKATPGGEALAAFARLGADVNYILTGRRAHDGGPFSPEEDAAEPPAVVQDQARPYDAGVNVELLRKIIAELERQLALEGEKEEPLTLAPDKKALAISMLYQRYVSQGRGAEIAGIERGVRDLLSLLH